MISSNKMKTLRTEGRAGLGGQFKVTGGDIRGVALLSVGDAAGSGTTIIDGEALTDAVYAIRNGGNLVYASADASLTDTANVVGELRNPKIDNGTLYADVILFDDTDTKQARERLLRFAGRKPNELTAICHTSYALARTGKQRREWRAVIGDFLGVSFALVTIRKAPATPSASLSRKNGVARTMKAKTPARQYREPLENDKGEPLGTCHFADGSTEEDCTERRCQANFGESWTPNSELPERGEEIGTCTLEDGSTRECTFEKCNKLGGTWQHPEREDNDNSDGAELSATTPGFVVNGVGAFRSSRPMTLGEAVAAGQLESWTDYSGRQPGKKQLRDFKRDQRIAELEAAAEQQPGVCLLPSGDTAEINREECERRGGEWEFPHVVEGEKGMRAGKLDATWNKSPALRKYWGTFGRFVDAANTAARDSAYRILRRDRHAQAKRIFRK